MGYKFVKNERGYSYELRTLDNETLTWKLEPIGAVALEDMIRDFCDTSSPDNV
jgi:hypothetical protein